MFNLITGTHSYVSEKNLRLPDSLLILKAFKKTTDQCRKEFRFAKITSNQNYSQFFTNIYRLFDYWIESAKIEKTYAVKTLA